METRDRFAMNDLDTLLSRMKDLPVDPRVNGIDDAVLAGLAQRAQAQVSVRAMALVAVLSLGVGVVGSIFPAQPLRAGSAFSLGAPAALAPSTLLGSGE
jgi:hypothetical protein